MPGESSDQYTRKRDRAAASVATANSFFPPLVFNLYKPAGTGSQDVVRALKRALPKGTYGKIGHFGTLDPFACGVLMVGVGGAARLNDLIHADCPKTYLARGLLGVSTATGDPEGQVTQRDASPYLADVHLLGSGAFLAAGAYSPAGHWEPTIWKFFDGVKSFVHTTTVVGGTNFNLRVNLSDPSFGATVYLTDNSPAVTRRRADG